MEATALSLSAFVALVPASLATLRRASARDLAFWSALLVAIAGPSTWVYLHQAEGWHTGFSTALWLTVLACLVLFAGIAFFSREGWKLAPLLLPYLVLLALLAIVWGQVPESLLSGAAPLAWIATHILISVATYGLITLAAVAALAAAIQERALKSHHLTGLSRRLPSLADSEGLVVRILVAGEIVLVLGVVAGMAAHYLATGVLIVFNHKTLFTLMVLAVIAVLLAAHFHSGLRGRAAVRAVLLAYLLLTLGYPGVKFVSNILLA